MRIQTVLGILAFLCLALLKAWAASQDAERIRALEAVTRANIGLGYLEQEAPGKAQEEFKKLIELVPEEALGYANLGLAFFRLDQPQEAERWVRRALTLDPPHAAIHVLLGEILQWQGRDDEAFRSYEKALETAPNHPRALYKLAKLAETRKEWRKTADYLTALTRQPPESLPILLDLSRLLLQNGWTEEALEPLRRVAVLFEGVQEESVKFLKDALALAEASKAREAAVQIQIFANLVRPGGLYRQGIARFSPQAFGMPIDRFSDRLLSLVPEASPRAIKMTFREAGAEVGLPTSPLGATGALFFDFDNDGHLDLFVCASPRPYLFRNASGRFVDLTRQTGLGRARCTTALAADFDNDGHVDLYLMSGARSTLYRNSGRGPFLNVTAKAGLGNPGRAALAVDLDHDGDLDLVVIQEAAPKQRSALIYRNQTRGRFQEITQTTGIDLERLPLRAAAFGDLDDDGDLDLLMVGDGAVRLYSNLRQGRLKEIAKDSGLAGPGAYEAAALGDYNNDGFLDIFLAGRGENANRLFRNLGSGRFAEAPGAIPLPPSDRTVFSNARFEDFDNDGYLDLLLAGASGLRLFRNNGRGGFVDASAWLPNRVLAASQVAVADPDGDGDLDILVAAADGRIVLLRNEGGNANRWLKVKLKGLNVDNSKNNLNGLGAKVEIKAGPLYQMRLVDGPVTHFGLGAFAKADLLRVVWTNGEADIIFEPSSDQLVEAEQQLKGSCPFLYTWDGRRYTFVTDIHWRNLLGMVLPDGSYAPPDPAKDYFKIPGEKLRPRDGVYALQITEELWETTFLDQVRLLAVDHPEGTEVFVNEAFAPPPFPPLQLHTIRKKRTPVAALDDHGNDILPLIRSQDGNYFARFGTTPYQGYAKEHSIALSFGDLSHAPRILLFLRGWLKPFDSSLNLGISQSRAVAYKFPSLQVIGKDGKWQTVIDNIGAPAGKDKTVVVDLTGKFPTTDFRVRITTTMEIAWDEIFVSTDDGLPARITPLTPIRADLHYRGFSRPYRATPDGPTLFDYAEVTQQPRWRPAEGLHTRYGDVRPLLLEPDDMYVVMGPGDEMTVGFDASHPPKLKPGWVRDFIIYTEGWIKEGEINGALSQTVEPLVFRGMSRYPYGPEERYPDDALHREFLRTYMTRLAQLPHLGGRDYGISIG